MMASDAFAVCGVCGCEVGFGEMVSSKSVGADGVVVEFRCHDGAFVLVACDLVEWVEWVASQASVFRGLMDDVSVPEVLEFWVVQSLVDAESIPVEV